MKDHQLAAGAFVTTPLGVVMVSEGNAPNRGLKIPGGRWKPEDGRRGPLEEITRRLVARKIRLETGIRIAPQNFCFKGIQHRDKGEYGPHEYYFFTAEATEAQADGRYREQTNNFTVYLFSGEELFANKHRIPRVQLDLLNKYNLWP